MTLQSQQEFTTASTPFHDHPAFVPAGCASSPYFRQLGMLSLFIFAWGGNEFCHYFILRQTRALSAMASAATRGSLLPVSGAIRLQTTLWVTSSMLGWVPK